MSLVLRSAGQGRSPRPSRAVLAGQIPRRDLWRPTHKREEIPPGVVFFHSWANVTALRTDAGLVLVDTGTYAARARTFAAVRAVDQSALYAAGYTHGHVDHACGLPPFLKEAIQKSRPTPLIVGHRNIAARFDRYRLTGPWNGLINSRQFSVSSTWPTDYDYPDVVYDAAHTLEAGGERLDLTHARGETDDHTWLWWPERRILFTGDLFIWVAPNAGNPQKVQRYAAEWARALRDMASFSAELLIPGHGVPRVGAGRERQCRAGVPLIDWAAAAAPDSAPVHAARADIYEARARASDALMTRGIFSATARESAAKAGRSPDPGP